MGGEAVTPGGYYAARDMLLLPDGKILVAGGRLCGDRGCGFALARFEANGKLDQTFGSNGAVFTPMTGVVGISGLARQPDGKLVAVGDAAAQDAWVLARYNEDGTLDSGFGSGGVTVTEAAENSAYAADVIVTSGGKLAVAGTLDTRFAVARYHPDGSLDDSFGVGGKVVTPPELSAYFAHALIELPDGRLLAAGGAGGPTGGSHDALVRLNADGSLDDAFGSHGLSIGLPGVANALLRQPDGKLVTASSSGLVRYSADGFVDPSFAAHLQGWIATDVVLQPDGKLVAVGISRSLKFTWWIVRRFLPNGALDPSFCFPPGGPSGEAWAAELLPDGKLLVAGDSAGFGSGYMLRRYLADGSGPCADLTRPETDLRIRPQRLGRVLARGLAVVVLSNEPSKASLRVMPTRRAARRFGITRGTIIGRASHRFAHAGRAKVLIPLTRAAKRRLTNASSVGLKVRSHVVDRAGNVGGNGGLLTLRR